MTTGSWWRQIAIDQLLVDPGVTGSWPKIIGENLGLNNSSPGNTWPEKIAIHLGITYTDGAEKLGKTIYLSGALIHP